MACKFSTIPIHEMSSKFVWRFAFSYLMFYIVPYGFEYIYFQELLRGQTIWTDLVPWFGEVFLGFDFDRTNLLVGFDSKFEITRFALCAGLALITTLLWILVDSIYKLSYEQRLQVLLITILRYHVGLMMLLYGMYKVIPLQFGSIDLASLETRVGDNTPMGLLWTFMSYSKFYTISTGLVEATGGALLLFRRSTLLGALLCLISMVNVVLIDIGYDATVKFFAIHLLVMVMLILQKRLMYTILHLTHSSQTYPGLLNGKNKVFAGYFLKGAIIFFSAFTLATQVRKSVEQIYDDENDDLRSLYRVEDFVLNGDTIPPLLTDTVRWKSFAIKPLSFNHKYMTITRMNDTPVYYKFKVDRTDMSLRFHPSKDTANISHMTFQKLAEDYFILHGIHQKDSVWIKAKAFKVNDYLLTKEGIQWIRDLK